MGYVLGDGVVWVGLEAGQVGDVVLVERQIYLMVEDVDVEFRGLHGYLEVEVDSFEGLHLNWEPRSSSNVQVDKSEDHVEVDRPEDLHESQMEVEVYHPHKFPLVMGGSADSVLFRC